MELGVGDTARLIVEAKRENKSIRMELNCGDVMMIDTRGKDITLNCGGRRIVIPENGKYKSSKSYELKDIKSLTLVERN